LFSARASVEMAVDTASTSPASKEAAKPTPLGKMVGLAGCEFGTPLAPEKPPNTPCSISVHQL